MTEQEALDQFDKFVAELSQRRYSDGRHVEAYYEALGREVIDAFLLRYPVGRYRHALLARAHPHYRFESEQWLHVTGRAPGT